MSVKSPLELVLYCYLNMPTINKTYLILSYLILRSINMNNELISVIDRLRYMKVYNQLLTDNRPWTNIKYLRLWSRFSMHVQCDYKSTP